jgi:hypothetical protein
LIYLGGRYDIKIHVQLKGQVVDHMAAVLDPHPFWTDNNGNDLISESILRNNGAELRMETLRRKLVTLWFTTARRGTHPIHLAFREINAYLCPSLARC